MAASARAFILSRVTGLSLKTHQPPPTPPLSPGHLLLRRSPSSTTAVRCLISGVDGGGVSDDFVLSTRKSDLDRGFSVIANMLRRIEPLDNSVISKGVSDSAKDSMKQTISSMLGLLPSDNFSVSIRFSKRPLDRLLVSSIITGYTLWNTEYRISLMRNFEISAESLKKRSLNHLEETEISEVLSKESEVGVKTSFEEFERSPQVFGDLSPEALNYIQQLQSELSTAKEELNARKLENMQIEDDKGNRNNLLEYLRSLDSDMVTELSRPSSLEVEEIIHQLVQNILREFFKDGSNSHNARDSGAGNTDSYPDSSEDPIVTSRDYLAKLLFWCMLLGHHLRGLENRLHLSCAVGLL